MIGHLAVEHIVVYNGNVKISLNHAVTAEQLIVHGVAVEVIIRGKLIDNKAVFVAGGGRDQKFNLPVVICFFKLI